MSREGKVNGPAVGHGRSVKANSCLSPGRLTSVHPTNADGRRARKQPALLPFLPVHALSSPWPRDWTQATEHTHGQGGWPPAFSGLSGARPIPRELLGRALSHVEHSSCVPRPVHPSVHPFHSLNTSSADGYRVPRSYWGRGYGSR